MTASHSKETEYMPADEGRTHINIYSKSNNALGRWLSNFHKSPFTHEEFGTFVSVEGFYYWLLTGKVYEELRELHGLEAREAGKKYERVRDERDEEFIESIKEAIAYKILGWSSLQSKMLRNNLPYTHYYYFGEVENPKVYRLPQHDYMVSLVEEISQILKERKDG